MAFDEPATQVRNAVGPLLSCGRDPRASRRADRLVHARVWRRAGVSRLPVDVGGGIRRFPAPVDCVRPRFGCRSDAGFTKSSLDTDKSLGSHLLLSQTLSWKMKFGGSNKQPVAAFGPYRSCPRR